MRTWTQSEYDAEARTSHGVILGTGDFRRIDFRGRHHVIIGPQSIIGKEAHMGESCQIGDNCDVGPGLVMGAFGRIGQHCHIGEYAMIGESCVIGRGTCFAADAACCSGMTGTMSDIEDGRRMLATAKYIRALFSAAGMCEGRRKWA